MTNWPCITWNEPDLRTCQIAGQHEAGCDGQEYRWDDTVQDDMSTGNDCTGCLPKLAVKGHVCGSCYGRITRAFEDVPEWLRYTEGILSAARAETGGGSAIGFVPFTALEMDRAEIVDMLDGATKDDVDRWVFSSKGAADAVRVTTAIRAALFKHPVMVEQENLDRARCPKCERLTLVRLAPVREKARDVIKCRDWACAFVATESEADLFVFRELDQSKRGTVSPA